MVFWDDHPGGSPQGHTQVHQDTPTTNQQHRYVLFLHLVRNEDKHIKFRHCVCALDSVLLLAAFVQSSVVYKTEGTSIFINPHTHTYIIMIAGFHTGFLGGGGKIFWR